VADKTHQQRHPEWTFLSNHTHVLHCIFLWPGIRIRDIAVKVLITERAVQRIVVDLEQGGYLKRERVGRQNQYQLKPGLNLRHPLEDHVQIGRLLAVLQPGPAAQPISTKPAERSAVVISRKPSAARRPAGAKAIVRVIKRTRIPGKLATRKSV
jgi:hypothetical protein